jgi:L-arabinokinase
MIVAYVSGHGFGHSTRVAEVLRAARALEPRVPLAVVTSAPEFLYRCAVPGEFRFRSLACDVGLVQRGALEIDEPGTVAAWRAFEAQWPALVDGEAAWLHRVRARAVLGDVPPLAFAAAARAGVASVALANFSWDWIYRHLARREPALSAAADACAAAYAECGLLLRLPFAGDLSAFPRIEDVGLVARRPRVARDDARGRLGFGGDARPLVLLSFGGFGLPGFDAAVLGPLDAYRFVVSAPCGTHPPHVGLVDGARLDALGLRYIDLVAACDVVVTKPGYGIVSDAIGAGARLVYTERGDFPEYPILVAEMPRYLACAPLDSGRLREGRLRAALEAVLAQPQPAPPARDGAERAAARLLERAA